MKEEKIFFRNSQGQKLCGLLAVNPRKPIIILIHGMMPRTDKHEFGLFDKLQPKFFEAGFSTFRFDFAGHGESEGDHVDVSLENYTDDLKSALDFVFNLKNSEVGIFANSFGCFVTLTLNDPRPKAVLLNSPAQLTTKILERVYSDANSDWKKEIEEKGYFIYKKAKLPKNRGRVGPHLYNLAKKGIAFKSLALNQPLLILSAGLDKYLKLEETKELFNLIQAPYKKLLFDKTAKHCFHNKPNKLSKIAISWFKEHLK